MKLKTLHLRTISKSWRKAFLGICEASAASIASKQAFIADLKEVMEGRCKGLVNHEKCNKKPVLQKRNISTRCNYGEMMKTISETVNIPMSSPIVQEVAENLLQIIKTARMSKTSFEVTGIRVPILDLTSIPLNDLWLLLHLFTQTEDTHPPRNVSKNDIQLHLMEYIPLTDVHEGMLKREVGRNCGQCASAFSLVSRSRHACASCERKFCKRCPIPLMKAPRIGINVPKPICRECTTTLNQKDAEDWITKAQELMKNQSHKAAMACMLMAVHSTEVVPLQHLMNMAKELISQGFQEQGLVILSLLHEQADLNDNIKVYLHTVKALQEIVSKPGKSWRDRWLLTLLAQQGSLLAGQALELSDSSIDVPDLSRKSKELVLLVTEIESEKEKEYNSMVKCSLTNLKKAWESRDLTEMFSIVTESLQVNEDVLIVSNGREPAITALGKFLDEKKGFLPRMMADDCCALSFFQGYLQIQNQNTQQGLDCIETAVWSGHHNKWLCEAAIPIVISQLHKHPSMKDEIRSSSKEIIQASPSRAVNFNGLLQALAVQQEDLNPCVKQCWPELCISGITQGATKKYERTIYQQVQDGKFSYCDAGYALIDFVPGACHPAEVAVCFLNAALWFLKELQAKKLGSSQQFFALKMVTFSCLKHGYIVAQLGLHPGMQFYVARLALAIAAKTIDAAGRWATAEDTEFIVELVHMAMYKGRFCPFWKIPIVPISEAVLLNILTGRLHTQFMLELQKHPNCSLLKDEDVKYQLYENDLRWTCRVDDRSATRSRAMEALLVDKGLSWSDISDTMSSFLNPRSPEGWLLQQKHLGGNLEFNELKGFELRTDPDNPSVKLSAVPTQKSQDKCGLFSTADIHTVLHIPSKDLFPIFFSLDPPSETERFHPFQQLRFYPSSLQGTDLLHTLLHTDYLMKSFSVGSDVSANPPFIQRDCSEGLTARLPLHLKEVLAPVSERGSCKNRISRFWIQADEIEFNITQTGSSIQCRIGAVKMVVRTQPQIPGLDGKLQDTKDEDPDSPESKFAKDLTENYNEISEYFPMFGRLRELCKLQLFGTILGNVLDNMEQKANGIGVTIPAPLLRDIQSQARRENESRVQQMLNEIKGNIGVWPAAENSAMISAMEELARERIRSQYGSYTYISREVESHISEAARNILRQKDEECVNQLTQQLREAMSGRQYQGNVRQCVVSWLSYGSSDLKNLILSSMPVPTEQVLREAIIAQHRKRFNAFKSTVKGISDRGRHAPKKSCFWVPAALKVDESDDGESMRMCYGGVLLAPELKERTSIPWSRNEVQYDLNRLNSPWHHSSANHWASFSAPPGLTTPKNHGSSIPSDFLPHLKPIFLHSETLRCMESSLQAVQEKAISHLAKVLASAGGGAGGGGGRNGTGRGGGRSGTGGNGGRNGTGEGGGRNGTGGGGDGNGTGGGGDGKNRNGHFILFSIQYITAWLSAFCSFQEAYETERIKRERVKRYNIRGTTKTEQEKIKKIIPNTKVIRDDYKQQRYRNSQEKKGVDISNMHAAHKAGLSVVRHFLIYVSGKELTPDDLDQMKQFFSEPFNLVMVPARENWSDHNVKDNAWKEAINEYLHHGCLSEATWKNLDLDWIKAAVSVFKRPDCPIVISQRVQILRQMVNPNNPDENLFNL